MWVELELERLSFEPDCEPQFEQCSHCDPSRERDCEVERRDFLSLKAEGGGIIALPGVKDLLLQIQGGRTEDEQGWSVCTSSTHFYASRALPAAGLFIPKNFVTAESVSHGKPAPDPYLLGAKLSGVDPKDC